MCCCIFEDWLYYEQEADIVFNTDESIVDVSFLIVWCSAELVKWTELIALVNEDVILWWWSITPG